MPTTVNIPGRVFPVGDTIIGPNNIPNGTSLAKLTLDVANQVPPVFDADGNLIGGQRVWLHLEWSGDGWVTSQGSKADFNGPWLNKQGVMQNDVSLTFGMSRPSSAGWQYRATVTVESADGSSSFTTAGGTLVLS